MEIFKDCSRREKETVSYSVKMPHSAFGTFAFITSFGEIIMNPEDLKSLV